MKTLKGSLDDVQKAFEKRDQVYVMFKERQCYQVVGNMYNWQAIYYDGVHGE